MNKGYKPLPDYLTIKESKIDGLGLFTKVDIPKGTHIGVSHIRVKYNVTEDDWLRLPLGGFYNHSDTPNCENVTVSDEYVQPYLELNAIDDIKVGDEITCKYIFYDPSFQSN